MFRMSFCAVPAFIRVLPVTHSGPTTHSMATSNFCQFRTFIISNACGQYFISVTFFDCNHIWGCSDAAIPMTESFSLMKFRKSFHPPFGSSSANSTAFLIAVSPPTIMPTTSPCSAKVGGHSKHQQCQTYTCSCADVEQTSTIFHSIKMRSATFSM